MRAHLERVVSLFLNILLHVIIGAISTTMRRIWRGKAQHPAWSATREIVHGASRRVLVYAGELFDRDPLSYAAWTTISEVGAILPVKLGLWSHNLAFRYFSADGVKCAAVFKRSSTDLVAQILAGGGTCHPSLIFVCHFHGGGYVAGGLVSAKGTGIDLFTHGVGHHDPLLDRIVTVHVDYTLGVDQRYPRAVQDGVKVFDWLVTHGGVLGSQIFLYGESGGGGLAACVMLALRDDPFNFLNRDRCQQPAAVILFSPMITTDHEYPYSTELEGLDIINGRLARGCSRMYCGSKDTTSPYATPIHAPHLGSLPPILLQTGELEIFDEPCRQFAEKCMRDGTKVQYEPYEAMVHCFQGMASVGCPYAKKAYDSMYSFIDEHAPQLQGS